ncbi:CRISPR-associated endonuclease Cas1 [Methanosarcina sp. KYL-1]|uniref:CRISPR-associated endonuclease Cas1 n=1 Tax=Methanosarcina sp. KYL-1 TaxID=2602068 RepID=UPI00350E35D1
MNTAGPDAHAGFLHEMNPGKNSLAYDLQEPFRFLIDLAVINLLENQIAGGHPTLKGGVCFGPPAI